MATADTVKNQLQALIDSANAKTGKADGDLTAAVDSLAAGYGIGSDPVLTELTITENGEYTPGEGVDGFSKVVANVAASGGSGAETGEITTTNFYQITIPVSSKKTRLLVWPQSVDDMWSLDTEARSRVLLAVEDDLFIHANMGKQSATGVGGSAYWNRDGSTGAGTAVFNNDSIVVDISYCPFAKGNYLWYAW